MSACQIDLGERTLHRCEPSVDANASLDSLTTRFAVEARQAIRKHLQELFQQEDEQQPTEPDPPPLEASHQPIALPTSLSAEEQEILFVHQAARHDWYASSRRATTRGARARSPSL